MAGVLGRRAFTAGLSLAAIGACSRARAAESSMCVIGQNGWLFSIWDSMHYSDPAQVQTVSHAIADASARLHAAGIAVAILLIPAKSRVYRDQLPAGFTIAPDSDRRYARARAALASAGATVPDVAGLLDIARTTDPQTDLFFHADTHWLPTAATVTATAFAKVAQGLQLPPSQSPGATLGPAIETMQQRNDLASLLPRDQQAKYPYQRYLLRPEVAITAAAGLTDTDTADVVVIGNSFMQPAYGFAPAFSNQLGRPVALDWRVHQFSPYWLMLDYLNSPAFLQRRPSLIVWNFEESDMEVNSGASEAWGPNAVAPARFAAELQRLLERRS